MVVFYVNNHMLGYWPIRGSVSNGTAIHARALANQNRCQGWNHTQAWVLANQNRRQASGMEPALMYGH